MKVFTLVRAHLKPHHGAFSQIGDVFQGLQFTHVHAASNGSKEAESRMTQMSTNMKHPTNMASLLRWEW